MTVSDQQVYEGLIRIGTVTESQIAEFKKVADCEGGPDALLMNLVAAGRLTPFQATRARQGRASELIMGSYLILGEIGSGAMGLVFKALHRRMDRVVAIKLIKAPVEKRGQFIARFQREVHAAARLNHPNAIAAYDAGDSNDGPYLVMEYVEGADLREIVRKRGPLKVHEALDHLRQAARGIAYAHSQGVIHRDIKPANLMRDVHGVVRIADLGIAHLVSTDDDQTEVGEKSSAPKVTGSAAYMSPEQSYDADSVDKRTDIYSLGCTLFFLLNAKPIFGAPTVKECLLAQRHEAPPSLCDEREDVPKSVDALFQKMVAKDRNHRHASMDDVIAELDSLLKDGEKHSGAAWDPADSTVLIAESTKTLTHIVSRMLEELGCDDIHVVESGERLVNTLSRVSCDVVIASMELPDMTGLELVQNLRSDFRWSRLSIVLMTAAITDSQKESLRRFSGVGVLEKPFTADQLQDTLTDVLHSNLIAEAPIANLDSVPVLIVDDSSVARRHIQRVLSDLGFSRFVHAEDGPPALEKLTQRHFEFVVVDYNMPQMNGRELVSRIRAGEGNHHDVPIVMCTTEFDPEKLAEVYRLGVSAVCNKSFDPQLVRNIVVRLFK